MLRTPERTSGLVWWRAGALTVALALASCDRRPAPGPAPAPTPGATPASVPGASAEKPKTQDPETVVRSDPLSPRESPNELPSPRRESPSPRRESPTTERRRYVVAALGDSITDARSGGGGYLEVLRNACPQSLFLNFGKGGDMTNQMRRRFERDVLPRVATDGIDTLLVYGGVNDLYSDLTAGRTNDRIEQDLTRIYDRAKNAGLQVVAITVSPWGGFSKYFNARRGRNTQLLNSWILGQVEHGPVDRVVDSYSLLSCGSAENLCPDYQPLARDGLHPGRKGHELLGEKLLEKAFSDCR